MLLPQLEHDVCHVAEPRDPSDDAIHQGRTIIVLFLQISWTA